MAVDATERRIQRIDRRIEELRAWRNALEHPISDWRFTADGVAWSMTLGDFWPRHALPATLEAKAVIPPDWRGLPVELELWLGGEGFLQLSTGYQAGLNPMHHRFPILSSAEGGETFDIRVECVPKGIFGSDIPEPRFERAHLVVPEPEVRAFERDLTMLAAACRELDGHDAVPLLLAAAELALSDLATDWPTDTATALSRYVSGYHDGLGSGVMAAPPFWRPEAADASRPTLPTWSLPDPPAQLSPLPDAARTAVDRARVTLRAALNGVRNRYPPVGDLVLTGHAHIDLAWLWPLAETRRKIRRTFSTVIDLMDRYPDFTFNQSSAQAYAWIAEDDPALFARIRERVAEGRWEPVGGMWVESDCNVTGGEALVRQFLYGQRYFEQTFGKRHSVAWLPDVFGFSGGMPQIMRAAGVTGFFTIKLNWNEATVFPFDLFRWEGIDGSHVTAHMFLNPGEGYNGNIVPKDTLGTWRHFRGKSLHTESLLAFGWGDGAGGPSEKMLENYDRLREFPALPRLRMGRIDDFYSSLPTDQLPAYVGELYFELHRGTLTSQGLVKSLNRQAEQRLVEAETFASLAHQHGKPYPREYLEHAWKLLLLNQFHDILPGSSIREVYDDSHRQLRDAVTTATRIRDEAIAHLVGGAGAGVSIANPGLHAQPLQAFIPGGTGFYAIDGKATATQPVVGGVLVQTPGSLPGFSVRVLTPSATAADPAISVSGRASDGTTVLENDLLRVEIGSDGTVHALVDKVAKRDALDGRANQLWAYVDKPRAWDAWDIDETHERDGQEIGGVTSIEILEPGPLRASVRVERRWRSSRIVQTYRLWAASRRLDIETEIDWHERQMLVKTRIPVAVRSHEAVFETMFGVVRRPTHRNTAADAAQFEGSAHRFLDISEAGYGVAVMNDGKYGHGVHGNVLTVSLVRGPLYPDPTADEGPHHFTYSIFPHTGSWTEAGVVAEARALNSPLITLPGIGGDRHSTEGVVCTGLAVELAAFKLSEDGEDRVLRVYEPHGARGAVELRFPGPVSVRRVNLLEESADQTEIISTDGRTIGFSMRPFELVTLRVSASTR